MSKTACWATNTEFDCAWVYFGYGSRYDMMKSPGYWLSLKAICALVKYDYDYFKYFMPYLNLKDPKERIIADQLGLEVEEDRWNINVPKSLWDKLPYDIVMEHTPISINHPDGIDKSIEWFLEVIKYVGDYNRNGHTETELYCDWKGNFSKFTWNIPLLKTIEKLNPEHYQWLKNIDDREEIILEEMRFRPDPWAECRAKPEDIQNMLDQWNMEDNERYEEFKNKNIWEQL